MKSTVIVWDLETVPDLPGQPPTTSLVSQTRTFARLSAAASPSTSTTSSCASARSSLTASAPRCCGAGGFTGRSFARCLIGLPVYRYDWQRGLANVRFAPKATEVLRCRKASLCGKTRLMQCSKRRRYSITSAAQPTSVMNNSRRLLIQLLRRQC
jgi:hypothetical protein